MTKRKKKKQYFPFKPLTEYQMEQVRRTPIIIGPTIPDIFPCASTVIGKIRKSQTLSYPQW